MTPIRLARLLAIVGAAAACSAEVEVVELNDATTHGAIHGLPFRMYEHYELAVWQRQPDGSFRQVHSERRTIPDQERLYVLRYYGLPLASATASIKMRDDGTLDLVDVKDADSEAPEALSEVAAQLKGIEEAEAARETAEQTAAAAGRTAELDYQTALKVALDSIDDFAALPPGDPTRAAAERTMKLRQIEANLKAAAAGRDPPFPGVSL